MNSRQYVAIGAMLVADSIIFYQRKGFWSYVFWSYVANLTILMMEVYTR